MRKFVLTKLAGVCLMTLAMSLAWSGSVNAAFVPGGSLDPTTIPQYVTPLVIPPVMKNTGTADDYDIAVRQFQQQILPAGFPATTVWSYGPAADPTPAVAPDPNSQFNYPAYTIEAKTNTTLTVDWINDLVDPQTGNYLPHILPIDQTLHWANPAGDCVGGVAGKDCRGDEQAPYLGPVPIVTHVHGANVGPESDGYPEAWWLPAASNITCGTPAEAQADLTDNVYVCGGSLVNNYGYGDNTNLATGTATYTYPNTQPSTTLWYHDHALGMTRNNVYAGPAGFWLIRDYTPGSSNHGETGLPNTTILPAPAPVAGDTVLELNVPGAAKRNAIREIPIVIQDRSFNADGTLFYPANRAFFEGMGDGQTPSVPGNFGAGLTIPFIPYNSVPSVGTRNSDISPIWNPEAFFNVMVVNGVAWPKIDVAPAIYRLRLLNGCNSRFLNLAMKQGAMQKEVPFYQIGAEQSLLPQVVRVETGFATPLPGNGLDVCNPKQVAKGNTKGCIIPVAAADPQQALLMGLAERSDVLVDFRGLADGDVVTMINTAPDAPFGGFPDVPADPLTSGQVMQFVVNSALLGASQTDPVIGKGNKPNANAATPPAMVVLGGANGVEDVTLYPGNVGVDLTRDLALIEEESALVCVNVDATTGAFIQYVDLSNVSFDPLDPSNACVSAAAAAGTENVPFAPREAVLGTNGSAGAPNSAGTGAQQQLWSDPITANPDVLDTEAWELWNWTGDAHPIHLHLVKFKVLERHSVVYNAAIPGYEPSIVPGNGVQPWEIGWKDTVISYPDEVTTVAATFDREGLYVWHCHIVEHEDNEMMVPYCVGDNTANGCNGL